MRALLHREIQKFLYNINSKEFSIGLKHDILLLPSSFFLNLFLGFIIFSESGSPSRDTKVFSTTSTSKHLVLASEMVFFCYPLFFQGISLNSFWVLFFFSLILLLWFQISEFTVKFWSLLLLILKNGLCHKGANSCHREGIFLTCDSFWGLDVFISPCSIWVTCFTDVF